MARRVVKAISFAKTSLQNRQSFRSYPTIQTKGVDFTFKLDNKQEKLTSSMEINKTTVESVGS